MNKIILKYEIDLDFLLIAITCPLKDYRLCYYINKHTGLNLEKTGDHETWMSSTTSLFFTKYVYISESTGTEFYLIGNKSIESGYLLPELRGSDYFLIIKEFIDEEDLKNLHKSLNSIPDVVVATEIDPEKLKSKENLVF
ncbi:IPExxxVDY family protein [Albibacterium indicum]|uniref:IPExxxVDY family protein n=1 Tax=Albibacterium indicum TaxID=2292082 RepID=UPI000E4F68F1|nr:IPExxxVDY family protein [Pedobacter indicus]